MQYPEIKCAAPRCCSKGASHPYLPIILFSGTKADLESFSLHGRPVLGARHITPLTTMRKDSEILLSAPACRSFLPNAIHIHPNSVLRRPPLLRAFRFADDASGDNQTPQTSLKSRDVIMSLSVKICPPLPMEPGRLLADFSLDDQPRRV
jgi:hypothetical protein